MTTTFKPFFVHLNPLKGAHVSSLPKRAHARAATLHVQPAEKDTEVQVRVALCSKSDNFCRATGRKTAENKKDFAVVNKRNLPQFVATIKHQVFHLEADYHNHDHLLRNFI